MIENPPARISPMSHFFLERGPLLEKIFLPKTLIKRIFKVSKNISQSYQTMSRKILAPKESSYEIVLQSKKKIRLGVG
jgi:hypothetical protein